ncbi:hypothetical protein SBA4_2520006 [Candidatus Sulfopaludibacter sp. SbA4]|nr:hypothetical protein SBA4_2520006 [Candidatus Sulfopaludibacter sp. SbA4]
MPNHKNTTAVLDVDAALAYKFWLARCFRDGSPEEDLLRAVCANSMNSGAVKPGAHSRQPPPSENGKRA